MSPSLLNVTQQKKEFYLTIDKEHLDISLQLIQNISHLVTIDTEHLISLQLIQNISPCYNRYRKSHLVTIDTEHLVTIDTECLTSYN